MDIVKETDKLNFSICFIGPAFTKKDNAKAKSCIAFISMLCPSKKLADIIF